MVVELVVGLHHRCVKVTERCLRVMKLVMEHQHKSPKGTEANMKLITWTPTFV